MLTSKFLAERLKNAGVKHLFTVPGDYVLDFVRDLWNNKDIQVILNTDENHSGFAADGYARVTGVGCVVATYSVGASKVINAVQCAYAERSPLIVISGAPAMSERNESYRIHHVVKNFKTQKQMFDEITCASVVLDNPVTAGYEIDRAFEALHYFKRPIYIELPRDVAKQTISYDVYNQGTPCAPPTDHENLQEALKEIFDWLKSAKSPAILAGVELARYHLSEQMIRFAEKHQIPVVTTLLSKSVIGERHPQFAGLYHGSGSREECRKIVEESDCLLMFGDLLTDMTLGFRPAGLKKRQAVSATVEGLRVRNHTFTNIQFVDFCKALFKLETGTKWNPTITLSKEKPTFDPKPEAKITSERLFAKINSILNNKMAICADIGDSLFGAGDLTVHHEHHFLSPAYYTTMGASIPYALGVQTALPDVRPIVIIGDGAFQMCSLELSTILQRGLNPIVFVLNNDGYTTERCLADGGFNDIRRWNYHKISELIGGGKGRQVNTEGDLEAAVQDALDSKELFVINVMLSRFDISPGLKRMAEGLGKRI